MINLHHRKGTTGLERSRYRLDIQDLAGSQLEQNYAPEDKAQVCPSCASAVNVGDRFCQECGTRIGTNRSKRSNLKDRSERIAVEAGSASIICINCGTTNKAFSTVCSDCKIPLIPAQRRREDRATEPNGLRGSLTTRSRRPVFQAPSTRDSTSEGQKPVESLLKPDDSKTSAVASIGTSSPENSDHAEPIVTSTKQNEVKEEQPGDGQSTAKKKKQIKQRLPGFISPVFKRPLGSDTSSEGTALDFLFADNDSRSTNASPFERLASETRSMGSFFSISVLRYHIDSFFERIPLPLLFLGVSVVIVCATVTATTHWNRYEQRLKAIDKIAINAEEKMRAFQLDEVINTMQELEKTEKGDLPPRARAVLDQSLWLRSYSHAKQHEYAKAISDLSFVTANFISYEDVVEKLAEYKKLLASHPEFASVNQAEKKPEPGINKREPRVKMAGAVSSESPKKTKLKTPTDNSVSVPSANTVSLAKEQKVDDTATKVSKSEKTTRPSKSQSALLDRDMKRYSNLLVEYFSSAESGQSDHVAEPPSYEEWTRGGKRDF